MENISASTTFAQRIEDCIRMVGGSASALAARVGVTPPAIAKYRRGSLPELDTFLKIAQAAGVSVEWLATGQGSVAAASPSRNGQAFPTDPIYIPYLVGSASGSSRDLHFAGTAAIATKVMAEAIFEDANLDKLAVCQIDDSSLRPELRKKAWVFVDTSKRDLFAGLGVFRINTQIVIRAISPVECEPGQPVRFQLIMPFHPNSTPLFTLTNAKLGGEVDLLGEVVAAGRRWSEKIG